MNDLSDIGLLRRQFRDVHSVVSRLDTQTRKLFEPSAPPRPAGLTARLAACHLIARARHSETETVGRQYFGGDNELAQLITMKSATGPAMSSVAGWAAELSTAATQDVAQNLLPATVLSQLRQLI